MASCQLRFSVLPYKIYHLPGGSLYRRTNINPDGGDCWFCTTKEADGAAPR
jgi:hypothetical protein